MTFLARCGVVVLAFSLCPCMSLGQPLRSKLARFAAYQFYYFQVPGAALTNPSSINDSLTVTGTYSTQSGFTGGFVRTAYGQITTFDAGLVYTGQLRINAVGDIAGIYQDVSGQSRGFVRSADGSITKFNPGGDAGSTDVVDLNDRGSVVGVYLTTNTAPPTNAFIRDPDGTITSFTVPGGTSVFPCGINDLGEVTGTYTYDGGTQTGGFVRSPGGTITTFTYSAGIVPLAINSAGTITGWYGPPVGSPQGFIRQPDGTITPFSMPNAGTLYTLSMGMNDAGVVTGSYTFLAPGVPFQQQETLGFARTLQGIVSSFGVSGAVNTTAVAINNANAVIGWSDSLTNPGAFIRVPDSFYH